MSWAPAFLEARNFTAARATSCVVIVQNSQVVDEWGDTGRKINVRSIRKSFLGALIGIHAAEGSIELGRTLHELGIDDHSPGLSALEKEATVLDLLRSRSGIYHPALYEAAEMKAEKPPSSRRVLVLQQLGFQRARNHLRETHRNPNL